MMLEVMVGALVLAAWKKAGTKGVLTPERERVYKSALQNLTDPDALKKLADEYDKQGLGIEGEMLRKRAALRGQSEVQKRARRESFDKGMASTNVEAIEALADAFESITATGSALALRQHAADLRRAQAESSRVSDTPVVDTELGESKPPPPMETTEEETSPVEVNAEVVDEPVKNGSHDAPSHRPRRVIRSANAE
jgi:hypothetical protein